MKGVLVQLFDETGAAYASGTNIAVMWFDSELPPDLGMIKGQSAIATTDASGWLSLDLDNVTGLAIGEFGFLVCYKLDGGDHRASPTFCSKMEVTSMTGTTVLGPLTDYVRNPDWPAQVAMVNGVQKFTGLLAVFDHDSNFIALQASGDYTVNWGDGGGDFNITGGVQAERNISYASVSGTIVGTSKAVAVTFTDTGDTVNRTAHGYQNGQRLNFASIVSTTGISTHTTYFVVNRVADTFQLAATLGGAALTLTTDGSGTVYIPEYKVALVTVTPQAGQNLTAFSLQVKHSSVVTGRSVGWLDIAINATPLTSIVIGPPVTPVVAFSLLFEARIGEHTCTTLVNLLHSCAQLQWAEVQTAGVVTFDGIFHTCTRLRGIAWMDTSSGVTFTSAFQNCISLQSILLLDLSSATTLTNMFYSCTSLTVVPLFDTSSALTFYNFLYGCGIRHIPQFDTHLVTSFFQAFAACTLLEEFPPLDTSSCTVFSSMLFGCTSLRTVAVFIVAGSTGFGNVFNGCTSLHHVPAIDALTITNLSVVLNACPSLSKMEMLNIGATINLQNCSLSSVELDAIYTRLATVVGKTITVTGNPGVSGDDPTIATAKGWTVTG